MVSSGLNLLEGYSEIAFTFKGKVALKDISRKCTECALNILCGENYELKNNVFGVICE
jgi:hypothetical protein